MPPKIKTDDDALGESDDKPRQRHLVKKSDYPGWKRVVVSEMVTSGLQDSKGAWVDTKKEEAYRFIMNRLSFELAGKAPPANVGVQGLWDFLEFICTNDNVEDLKRQWKAFKMEIPQQLG